MRWTIHGYTETEGPNLKDVVQIIVYADNEEQALEQAKRIYNKPHYRVMAVEEPNGTTKKYR